MSTGGEVRTGSSPARRPAASPEIELLRRFVNTKNVEERTDELQDPAGVRAWLRAEGLPAPARVSEEDVDRVRGVREALRAIALANNEGDRAPRAEKVLDDAAQAARLGVRFRDGGASVEPVAGGIDAAIGTLLGIVHDAMQEGTWPRFKACRNDECLWAFYDSSRNRGGHWCTMAVCGSRMKSRTYRGRNATRRPRGTGASG